MPIEYEAKFLGIDKDSFRKTLEQTGYTCVLPEFLFKRHDFDLPGFGAEKWGRVRWENDKINLSIKHTVDKNRIDGTHEFSVNVPLNDNPVQQYQQAIEFMKAAGLIPGGIRENKREIWIKDNVEISIDTWPGVRPYIEIEAENEDLVRKVCIELNLQFSKAMFGGITTVYEEELGITAEDFITFENVRFDNPPKQKY